MTRDAAGDRSYRAEERREGTVNVTPGSPAPHRWPESPLGASHHGEFAIRAPLQAATDEFIDAARTAMPDESLPAYRRGRPQQ
jgi:hypothetical protein